MRYSLKKMKACTRCGLHETRTQVVPGRGDPNTTLWLTGEAPGRDEDLQGLAFVGRAGRVLDMCLKKAGILHFYIVNMLKCRPPDNRDPQQDEMTTCTQAWLCDQIREHNPKVIVAMGRYSVGFFRGYAWKDIKSMRVTKEVAKKPFRTRAGRIVIPTFHPAYLCRNGDEVVPFITKLRLAKALHDTP